MHTEDQRKDAIKQMLVACDVKMNGYVFCSARSLLVELGYDEEQITDILGYIAARGFDYCLDHTIKCSTGVGSDGRREYPSQDVCYWGPDQLKSRLEWVK